MKEQVYKCCFNCDCAIQALKEKAEREKGCEYCEDYKFYVKKAPMLLHEECDSNSGVYLYDGFLICNVSSPLETKINYCPMYGRKLV